MTVDTPFLVVGGGIGGLATALSLARKGCHVRVLERAPEFVEIGAGMQLGPNAGAVLQDFGILEAVRKDAFFPQRLVMRDILDGTVITALDLGPAFRRRYAHPYMVTHRSDLLRALLDACRAWPHLVRLETGQDIVSVETEGEVVRVITAAGDVITTPALIGADGLHSRVRRSIVEDDPVCSRYVAYRGTIPTQAAPVGSSLNDVTLWTGPRFHFVQYPVRRGELLNQVAVFESDRYRADSEDWGTPEELEDRFRHACPVVRAGLETIERNRHWPLYDREPIATWTRGAVALLGDAAHPMLQYLAQGACQALEDAACLGEQVGAHHDVRAAFAAYAAARVQRASRVQTDTRAFGEVMHLGGMGAALRTAFLRLRAHTDYEHVDWLYGTRMSETRDVALMPG